MSTEPAQRPVVLFDGKCGFCKRHIARWSTLSGDSIDYIPFQERGERFSSLKNEDLGRALHLVEPSGTITRGAEAVFRILALGGRPAWRECYEQLPGFAWVTETGYRFMASHRDLVDPIDRFLFGKSREPLSHRLTVSIFLRALGVVYLIAFTSLWVQIDGLIGSRGILPIAPGMEAVKHSPQPPHIWELPTLCWISASDGFLHFLCAGGVVMSLLLIIGVLPFAMLVGLWVFYLSLTVAGQTFLSFQWDSLLLESGSAALFVAPMQLWMNSCTMREPSRIGVWLLRWLAFRIMFLSGVTKLIWDDACWRDGTALLYHYWSQPLPPWTAWYMNRLPLWFQKFSVWVMYAAEVVAPFLTFTPRMPRRITFWATVIFQTLIIVTGNYGFFNILTIVVALSLLDDSFWPRRIYRQPERYRRQPIWSVIIRAPAAAFIVFLSCIAFAEVCRTRIEARLPAPILKFYERSEAYHSANWYALFRSMTKQRYEIVIEGSDDGEHWKIYEFKYKPGDINYRPPFVTPHMPRLDWQMWFQALNPQPEPWFVMFLQQLLEGSKPVEDLLKTNPFPDHPPRYIHALMYDYHFADDPKGQAWWKRTLLGEYVPTSSLRKKE